MPHAPRRNGHRTRATTRTELATRLALYARVSSEEQADKDTIQAQLTFLRHWAALYDLPIVAEYTDDPASGLISLAERPGGAQLLAGAHAGMFTTVVCTKVDRLSRSLWVLLDGHRALEAVGVALKSATEPIDTADPVGKFLFQLLGAMAELDRTRILDQMNRGRDRVTAAGKWLNGPIPLGYEVDQDKLLIPSTRVVMEVGLTEADLLRDLFQRIAQGSSGVAEAARLQALGVPLTRYYSNGTQHTSARGMWQTRRILTMLRNTIYKGEHTVNSRFGAITRQVPALVAADLWEQANAQIRQNQAKPKSNATRIYLLSGLIKCALCRKAYVGQRVARRGGKHAPYYRCNRSRGSQMPAKAARCRNKMVNALDLETHIWQRCRSFVLHPDAVVAELARQRAQMPAPADTSAREQALARQLVEKQQEDERLLTLFRRGRITLPAFEAEQDAIEAERTALQAELTALHVQHTRYHTRLDYFARSEALLARWRTELARIEAEDDREAMQRLVHDLVASVTVHRAGVEIVYRFEAADDGAAVGEAEGVALGSNARTTDNCHTITEVWPRVA